MTTTITPQIVILNTTVTPAPVPSQLQQSGAVVSAGGTTLAAGTYQYIGLESQLTSILAAPLALTTLSWSGGTVTATTTANLELTTGQTFTTTIAGAVPAAYNGTYVATVTSVDTFTFALAANPGSETSPGTYTPPYSAFLQNAANSFFAQSSGNGSPIGFYVLELGPETTASAAITALSSWIVANSSAPQLFYAYLTPASWDSAALNTLAESYSSPTGQTYFFVTTTAANLATFYAGNKAVFATVTSPTAASTEHQAAIPFYECLVNNPGPASKLRPMGLRFAYGAAAWPQASNQTTLNNILTAYGNFIGTAAQGGLSENCLYRGTTMDGFQFQAWYGLDWFRIHCSMDLTAAVINGSNSNPPLEYDQPGINSLLAVAQRDGSNAVSYGCAQAVTVTAVPFNTYVTQNPSNYAAGIYGGFSGTLTFQNSFQQIIFNLDATQFVA